MTTIRTATLALYCSLAVSAHTGDAHASERAPAKPPLRPGPTLAVAALSADIRTETAAAEPAAAAPRMLGVSDDDIRPSDQLTIDLFGAPLTIGGEFEGAFQSQSNFDLDKAAGDQRLRALPEAKIEAFYQPADNIAFFAQAKGFLETELEDAAGARETEGGVSLDQLWGLWSTQIGDANFALQVGRQQFQDRREWWWDDDLEAVRLHFARGRLSGFFAVAEKIWSASSQEPLAPDEKDQRRYLANVAFAFEPRRQAEIFFLMQRDHSGGYINGASINEDAFDDADADLTWIGARYRGRHKIDGLGKFYLSLDGALVRGEETLFGATTAGGLVTVTSLTTNRVKGEAFDGALSWELPLGFEPIISAGYAFGSGDSDPADARDANFRQTGLHGNNGKFRGISRFRYYGEALRPDLSNIRILTASLGAPIVADRIWAEAVFHQYRQGVARADIPGSRLDLDPTGLSRKIGREFDFILSYEHPDQHWEAELSAGAFKAGEAFGANEGEWAMIVAAKLNYNF